MIRFLFLSLCRRRSLHQSKPINLHRSLPQIAQMARLSGCDRKKRKNKNRPLYTRRQNRGRKTELF